MLSFIEQVAQEYRIEKMDATERLKFLEEVRKRLYERCAHYEKFTDIQIVFQPHGGSRNDRTLRFMAESIDFSKQNLYIIKTIDGDTYRINIPSTESLKESAIDCTNKDAVDEYVIDMMDDIFYICP